MWLVGGIVCLLLVLALCSFEMIECESMSVGLIQWHHSTEVKQFYFTYYYLPLFANGFLSVNK